VGIGRIALLVFARAELINSGAFRLSEPGKGRVSSGTNLGVSRFHNKVSGNRGFTHYLLQRAQRG
jgi:hypothetical protein